MFGQLIKLKT